MTFAHFSDTHLGFRAYGRTTPQGINQREVDVMQTFRACLEAILARDPDVVVHAGDLFHVVRPSNATIVATYEALSRFQERRQGKPFVLIGGNHDSPRTSEIGNILKLYAGIRGMVIETGAAAVRELDSLDLEVLCVPSNSLLTGELIDYKPTAGRRHSLLTMHGMARQALPEGAQFDVLETRHERWTYVALGDYHVHQAYGNNVCYAGSTDFTSTNIWEETGTPKGWVWFDSEVGQLEFVPLQTRSVMDLPVIDAKELSSFDLNAQIDGAAVWDPAGLPIVRQKVINLRPEMRAGIDQKLVRELAGRALHYRLALVPPPPEDLPAAEAPGSVVTIEKSWSEHVHECETPVGLERKEIEVLGLSLLREVRETEADPAGA